MAGQGGGTGAVPINVQASHQAPSYADSGRVVVNVLPINYGSQPQINANMPSYAGGQSLPNFQRMPSSLDELGAGSSSSPIRMESSGPPQYARAGYNPEGLNGPRMVPASIFGDDTYNGVQGSTLVIVLLAVAGLAAVATLGRGKVA